MDLQMPQRHQVSQNIGLKLFKEQDVLSDNWLAGQCAYTECSSYAGSAEGKQKGWKRCVRLTN